MPLHAIKHVFHDGNLHISAYKIEQFVVFSVSNYGDAYANYYLRNFLLIWVITDIILYSKKVVNLACCSWTRSDVNDALFWSWELSNLSKYIYCWFCCRRIYNWNSCRWMTIRSTRFLLRTLETTRGTGRCKPVVCLLVFVADVKEDILKHVFNEFTLYIIASIICAVCTLLKCHYKSCTEQHLYF